MHLPIILIFLYLLSISIISIDSISIAKISNAIYSAGSSFSQIQLSISNACICYCINHPHCLSISVTITLDNMYNCQLFATYPSQSSQLSPSTISNVTVYIDRTKTSVYLNNGTGLTNPTKLFSNTANPWIPLFKLFNGNNQTFLDLNSSSLTTLTTIPTISVNQTAAHWFNVLVSQWNGNSFAPNQVALAFIVNRTVILDFLIFNATQANITNWFLITRLISTQFWALIQYQNTPQGQTQMKSLYVDSDSVRSFNCNFKNGCSSDFYGLFFVYGGYNDQCIAAVRNISKVQIPTIFYSPTSSITNGNLNYYNISDGLMGFVR